MAKKKSSSKKSAPEKSTMIKIAGKVGELAGKLVNEKNHLMEVAGGAIDKVKTAVHDITARKVPEVNKNAAKKTAKKAVKKTSKPAAKKASKAAVVKKAPPVKKGGKKIEKKGATKSNAAGKR
ncbi:MAG: hypothetical protein IPO83_09615 [Chitinophagaceae bacterium]|nr:hypothetical protein [Chitinophagaceae bacterium]